MREMSTASAKTIVWDYLQIHGPLPTKVDVIIVLGSRDDRVAVYAAEVAATVDHDTVYITGGSAHHGDLLEFPAWAEASESAHFATVMRQSGYSREITLEEHATNTGQNAQYVQKLMEKCGLPPASILIVTKPYMERRALRTFDKQWTYGQPRLHVTSTSGTLEQYIDKDQTEELVCNVMVGDLERIIEYPKQGFMTESEVPPDVLEALDVLKKAGYDKR